MAKERFYGTGRRKKSIARVYLVPGTGKVTINKRDIDEYFGLETLKLIVRQPLAATQTADKFDVVVQLARLVRFVMVFPEPCFRQTQSSDRL